MRNLFQTSSIFAGVLVAVCLLHAQDDPKLRIKIIHDLAKGGSSAIEKIEPYVTDPVPDVRIEAVKAIVEIGTQRSLDPLIKATADSDPEMQIRATDGLVNFYLPGYARTGLGASFRRMGTSIKSKFTDTNDQVIDAFIQVRPEVVLALGKLARGGSSMEARANAARAVGILRGREAKADLEQALRSRDSRVIYESLIALQKIRDRSAGPSVAFLIHDLDEKVQITAIETTGLLGNAGAIHDLRDILDRSKKAGVKRAALTAMAQIADPQLHGVFIARLDDKDDGLREAAAEGVARSKDPSDLPKVESAFSSERKTGPRLSLAFALASLGKRGMADLDPLRYLVNTLNSAAYRGVARAYLIELARDASLRAALYPVFEEPSATKDEKSGLAQILASSGDRDSIAPLEALAKNSTPEVTEEALKALRTIRARLP